MKQINLKFNKKVVMYLNDEGTYLPGQNVQDSINSTGEWSPKETKFLQKVLSEDDEEGIVVDVGSNTGYFSLIALCFGRKTIAIEPNIEFNTFIESSVKKNGYEKNFKLINKFATDRKGLVIFDNWSGKIGIVSEHAKKDTETISIKEAVSNQPVFFLKIDVEGAEDEVLRSCYDILTEAKIKYMSIEVMYEINKKLNHSILNELDKLHKNYNFYLSNSFLQITNFKKHFQKASLCGTSGIDIYACRKDAIQLK
mgnify:CR=1 FL=1|tara:strand:- start:53 stop:814 length:762 start_codon:yes stop_codon:yes gene_type:complete